MRPLFSVFLALLVCVTSVATGAQSKADSCHIALNNFWLRVAENPSNETGEAKTANHNLIRSLLATCEDVTPYFKYDELGAPEGTFSVSIFAIYLDDVDLFKKYLADGHPIDLLPNPYSDSSVFWAVHRHSASILAWLVDQGVDVNHAGDGGETPLMIAATHDQSVIDDLAVLIKAGADVNAVDSQGRNALVYALWTDNKANAIYLMAQGASVGDARSFLLGDLEDIRSDGHRDSVERQLAMLASIADAK